MSIVDNLITQKLMDKYGESWFKVNEGIGTVLNDSKGTVIGTNSGATWTSSGLSFDGIDDYVRFNSKIIPSKNFSFKFNIETTQIEGGNVYPTVLDTRGGNGALSGITVLNYKGNLLVQIYNNNINLGSLYYGNIANGDSMEVFISMSSNKITLFVNKVKIAELNITVDIVHKYNLTLGRLADGTSSNFVGKIKDIQFYNRALSPEDFNLYQSFILDRSEYKVYNSITSNWQTISNTTPTIEQFINQGMDSLSPLLDRVNGVSAIDQLPHNFKITTWTNKTNAKLLLQSPTPAQIVYPKGDISLFGVETIDNLVLTANDNAKVGISFDSGLTWKAYKNGAWIELDSIHNGMTVSEINALTNQQIMEAKGDSQFIRFSYSLSGNAEVDSIEMKVSMQGTEKIADSSDYDLSYDSVNKTIVYNIKKSGTYSVNYVT